MKIHILYSFQSGPWGGGNQFLKALKKELERIGVYTEKKENADVILFNSHHFFNDVFKFKKRFPNKIFVHRIDGPLGLYRGKDKIIDKIIFKFNNLVADGTVFQSHWSKKQNQNLYNNKNTYETVAYNAPDGTIFNKQNKRPFKSEGKVRLIAISWSDNIKKGFDTYKHLDENLDFSKYEMTFVGNSPLKFQNIKHIKAVPSNELANVLKSYDIYITASQKDPCSNSLIEALSSGLPAVVLNDGGHPELVQQGGEVFDNKNEIIGKIDKIANNYPYYQSKIPEFSIQKTAEEYYNFVEDIFHNKEYRKKKVTLFSNLTMIKLRIMFLFSKI